MTKGIRIREVEGEDCPSNTRSISAKRGMISTDSIFDLSSAEKLQLVEDLWDDLAATPSEVPVHDWQKEELERRKANLRSKPDSGVSWDDVKARIRKSYDR